MLIVIVLLIDLGAQPNSYLVYSIRFQPIFHSIYLFRLVHLVKYPPRNTKAYLSVVIYVVLLISHLFEALWKGTAKKVGNHCALPRVAR